MRAQTRFDPSVSLANATLQDIQLELISQFLRPSLSAGLAAPPVAWTRAQFQDDATKLNRPANDHWGYQMSFAVINRIIGFIWSNGGEVHDAADHYFWGGNRAGGRHS